MKSKTLPKKLKQYAALAISAVATDASAQIVYTNINDTTLVNNGDFFDISLNNDGIMEARISMLKYSTSNSYYIVNANIIDADPLNGADVNIVQVVSTTSYSTYTNSYAAALNLNQPINNALNVWTSSSAYIGGYASIVYGTQTYTTGIGQFPGAGDKYLGLRFNIGTAVHFGWVRLDVDSISNRITIKDYAYQSTPNTPIAAGDMGTLVGIEKLNIALFDFYASNGAIVLKNSVLPSTNLSVFDLSGKLLEQKEIANGESIVKLDSKLNGIYIVELRNEEGISRKKLWLESK